jgi:hypothetical protein
MAISCMVSKNVQEVRANAIGVRLCNLYYPISQFNIDISLLFLKETSFIHPNYLEN